MNAPSLHAGPDPRHVSLVALPDAVVSTLTGIFDVMIAIALMACQARLRGRIFSDTRWR